MRQISQKQFDAIVKLPDPKRFEHTIKQIAAWEEVWGLYRDGWALMTTDDEKAAFPIWPAREYAQFFSVNEQSDYNPNSMHINDFLEFFLPDLQANHYLIAVFPLPAQKATAVELAELEKALEYELSKY